LANHRFVLEPYKSARSRHVCPSCGAKQQFAKYLDSESEINFPEYVGKCNRELKCSYHYTPKQFFIDNPEYLKTEYAIQKPIIQSKGAAKINPSFIPFGIFQKTTDNGIQKENNLISFLNKLFGEKKAAELKNQFNIGTSKHWPGANIFWQMDLNGNLRTGKVMLYDKESGKRVKVPYDKIDWVHSLLKKKGEIKEFNLAQCFYGIHQINTNPKDKPVAIVESEKTAVIASVYLPEFIWIATGGKNGCKWLEWQVNKDLKGRNVFLFPDINFYNAWSSNAIKLGAHLKTKVAVSDLLEKGATEDEKSQGLDIADYLIKFPVPTPEAIVEAIPPQSIAHVKEEVNEPEETEFIDQHDLISSEVEELINYFNYFEPEQGEIRLNKWTVIKDVKKFLHSHLLGLCGSKENGHKRNCFERLSALKLITQKQLII
jgi:hypothetical protein